MPGVPSCPSGPAAPAPLPPVPVPPTHTDGPADGYSFWWRGREWQSSRAERRLYRLLVVMWPAFRTRTPVTVQNVGTGLVQAGGSLVEPRTLANYARDLSGVLWDQLRFPARLVVDGGYVRWKDHPDGPARP